MVDVLFMVASVAMLFFDDQLGVRGYLRFQSSHYEQFLLHQNAVWDWIKAEKSFIKN